MYLLPYLGLLVLSAAEGDVVFSAAVVGAQLGRLDPLGVLITGTIGAWAGDQFYFYAARGPLTRWLDRLPRISNRRRAIEERMKHHAMKLILAVRFLPGLRIAIPVASAYAGISPVRFSTLSFVSAMGWSTAIMFVITWIGPKSLAALGLKTWWAPIIPAIVVVVFFRWLSKTGTVPEE